MAKKKSKKRTRNLLLVFGILALVLVGVTALLSVLGNRSSGVSVEIADAEIRTVTQKVTASGRVQPEVEVIISPDVSGEIILLPVVEGQTVRQGQLLARIRPDFYAAQVEQAEASVQQARAGAAQAKADLTLSEQELARQKQLFEREVIAEDIYQQAQTRYEVALATRDAANFSVESSEARLRQAEEDLRKTTLYAPMDGTISQLNVELGERVVGTSQMAGTDIMTVARLEQMEIEVEVNENDVVNVSLGDTASIEIDAFPERVFTGVVTEIANSARLLSGTSQNQVTNFPVKVRILDPHNIVEDADDVVQSATLAGDMPVAVESYPSFRPGMSGTVDIYTHTVSQVVAVPIQAVTVRDFNEIRKDAGTPDSTQAAVQWGEDLQKAVFLFGDEGSAEIVVVETGIADDRFIEVRSGLEGGERVIIGPYSAVSRELAPGTEVRERTGF